MQGVGFEPGFIGKASHSATEGWLPAISIYSFVLLPRYGWEARWAAYSDM